MKNKKVLLNKENVQYIIDEFINPGLAIHNGFVILADIELEPPTIILEFHGGCTDCPARFTYTLDTIISLFREELKDENLLVLNAEKT